MNNRKLTELLYHRAILRQASKQALTALVNNRYTQATAILSAALATLNTEEEIERGREIPSLSIHHEHFGP